MKSSMVWSATFVVLWSTGFIGARYGLPYAEPMTLLAIRFAAAAALLLLASALFLRARRAAAWPSRKDAPWIALVGVLMHGGYLGCVFVSMSWGVEAGAAAVIAGLSPVFTALGARLFLGEPLGPARALGMALGFGGVALVVWEKLDAGIGSPAAAAVCGLAPIAFAAGALLQKSRLGAAPMISGNMVQYAAAALFMAPFALGLETNAVDWSPELFLALGWMIFALSIGAIFLLYHLLRRGEASSVSSVVFLVPSATALMAWAIFDETLGALALAGVAVSALGVALVNGVLGRGAFIRRGAPRRSREASPR